MVVHKFENDNPFFIHTTVRATRDPLHALGIRGTQGPSRSCKLISFQNLPNITNVEKECSHPDINSEMSLQTQTFSRRYN